MYNLKVLAVDDEPGMRHGIVRALANYRLAIPDIEDEISLSVDTAENGKEAIEKFNALKPDILLLDYKLPDISGLEVLDTIDSREELTLTIMITAYASLDIAVSAVKSGAFDFLAKPFTPNELRNTIHKAARSIIQTRQIKKLNEEKRHIRFQFISVLGHELKSPLGAIEGYLYMLKDKVLGEEMEKYDEMVGRCLVRTDQMRKLIMDLLEMTKIESGNRERNFQAIDLHEVAEGAIESVLPDATKRNITINMVPDTPILMKADRQEMEIIFNNLISNAVKYNKDGGSVDIFIVKESDKITLKVKDTGIGLSEEEIAKLFKEFVRIKNQKTRNILGSGLGLSTVKKIAQLYGGDARVISKADEGSEFKVEMFESNLV